MKFATEKKLEASPLKKVMEDDEDEDENTDISMKVPNPKMSSESINEQ